MRAAEALGHALAEAGLDTVLANPGTSELHLVDGLAAAGIRQVLTLFEGVASGAADGYARMRGVPAAVLIHLGPGLGNALANLHNARRARTPIVVLIGDHATEHKQWDVPLQSDIAAVARTVSVWVREADDPAGLADLGRAAVSAAIEHRGIATLIIPADVAWSEIAVAPHAHDDATDSPSPLPSPVLAALGSDEPKAIIVGGGTLDSEGAADAQAIAAASGARLFTETFPPRIVRGGGRVSIEPIPYLGAAAADALQSVRQIILIGAAHPASFFAYPGQPSDLTPAGATVTRLETGREGLSATLARLRTAIAAPPAGPSVSIAVPPFAPASPLTAETIGQVLAVALPDAAIVSDEATTAGPAIWAATRGARTHDWLRLTGGAIGQGLPLATGAALAAPGRRVVALQSDGAALYTAQALWTQAREGLNVTTVLLNNRRYAILAWEMVRLGLYRHQEATAPLFDLASPPLDFVALATGFGVSAVTATTTDELADLLSGSFDRAGPMLIDARMAA